MIFFKGQNYGDDEKSSGLAETEGDTEGFHSGETLVCNTIHVIVHLFWSRRMYNIMCKPYYELGTLSDSDVSVQAIDCSRSSMLVRDFDSWGGGGCVVAGSIWDISVLCVWFCGKPKIVLKNKIYLKSKNYLRLYKILILYIPGLYIRYSPGNWAMSALGFFVLSL